MHVIATFDENAVMEITRYTGKPCFFRDAAAASNYRVTSVLDKGAPARAGEERGSPTKQIGLGPTKPAPGSFPEPEAIVLGGALRSRPGAGAGLSTGDNGPA